MEDQQKRAFEISSSLTVKDIRSLIHEIVLVAGIFGFGTHAYNVKAELADCKARLAKIEKIVSTPSTPGSNPGGDSSGPPPVPQSSKKPGNRDYIAPDYTRLIRN